MDTHGNGFFAGQMAYEAAVAQRCQLLREELSLIFATPIPSVLELGSGHGHFLTSYAATHSGQFCIGVDRMKDRVRRATKKRNRSGIGKLLFLQCDALEFLACLPPTAFFDRVFVLFPDPWPKKRHHKNRLLSESFFDSLAPRCLPGAEFYFRTDHNPYFEEVERCVSAHPSWILQPAQAWPFEEPSVFQQRAPGFSSLIAVRSKTARKPPPSGDQKKSIQNIKNT